VTGVQTCALPIYAGAIADALIVGNDREPHWSDSARILIKALILYTLTLPAAERHLITVWRLLSETHPLVLDTARRGECATRMALLKLLQAAGDVFDGAIAGAGRSFAQMADREQASVFSTAKTRASSFSTATAWRPCCSAAT
jgi:type IV secretion system protein VirD4